MSKKSESATNV
jgi:hypothetical protein